jgi:hypothetical protein
MQRTSLATKMACEQKDRPVVATMPDDPSERSVDALERFFIQHAPLIR